MPGMVIAPSTESGFVALGATRQGRLFRKHILTKGTLLYPGVAGGKVEVDDAFVNQLKANFEADVCPIVQVPLAGPKNEHTEEPDRNIGQVVGLEEGTGADTGKVFALIDARKHAEDLGSTLLGASAMMSLDYTDTKTNTKVGPALLHVAVTNRPYVTDLDGYSEVVAASAEYSDDAVLLTPATATLEKEVTDMDKAELLAALKALEGADAVDVEALLAENASLKATKAEGGSDAGAAAALAALTSTLAGTGLVELTAGTDIGISDVITAVAQLAERNVNLTNTVVGLTTEKAEASIDALIAEGRILPAQRAAYLSVKLSNQELFDQLVPEKPLVTLSQESGFTPPELQPQIDVDAEIARYVDMLPSIKAN